MIPIWTNLAQDASENKLKAEPLFIWRLSKFDRRMTGPATGERERYYFVRLTVACGALGWGKKKNKEEPLTVCLLCTCEKKKSSEPMWAHE